LRVQSDGSNIIVNILCQAIEKQANSKSDVGSNVPQGGELSVDLSPTEFRLVMLGQLLD
ncbi:13172_t:CDS:1, partial [Ambispora gerdemannii]